MPLLHEVWGGLVATNATFPLQVKNNPYMSHGDRELVVAEHDAKSTSDPLHRSIEADLKTMRAKNSREGVRTTKFFDPRQVCDECDARALFSTHGRLHAAPQVARKSPVDAAILAILDYNSVSGVD